MEELFKLARSKRQNPEQEKIVSDKEVLNDRTSKLISLLIETKRGWNGKAAPGIGITNKSPITNPLPLQIDQAKNNIESLVSDVMSKLEEVKREQNEYAEDRKRKLEQRLQSQKSLSRDSLLDELLMKTASNPLSRFWAHLSAPFASEQGRWDRLSLLRALVKIEGQLTNIEDNILRPEPDAVYKSVFYSKDLFTDIKSNLLNTVERYVSTAEKAMQDEINRGLEVLAVKKNKEKEAEKDSDQEQKSKSKEKANKEKANEKAKEKESQKKILEEKEKAKQKLLEEKQKQKQKEKEDKDKEKQKLLEEKNKGSQQSNRPKVLDQVPVAPTRQKSNITPEQKKEIGERIRQPRARRPAGTRQPAKEPESAQTQESTQTQGLDQAQEPISEDINNPQIEIYKLLNLYKGIILVLEHTFAETNAATESLPNSDEADFLYQMFASIFYLEHLENSPAYKSIENIKAYAAELEKLPPSDKISFSEYLTFQNNLMGECTDILRQLYTQDVLLEYLKLPEDVFEDRFNIDADKSKEISILNVEATNRANAQINNIKTQLSIAAKKISTAASSRFSRWKNRVKTYFNPTKTRDVQLKTDKLIRDSKVKLNKLMDYLEKRHMNLKTFVNIAKDFFITLGDMFDSLSDLAAMYNNELKLDKLEYRNRNKKIDFEMVSQTDISSIKNTKTYLMQMGDKIANLENLETKLEKIKEEISQE
jgi:chemotaxis protein histidine kinase CheA